MCMDMCIDMCIDTQTGDFDLRRSTTSLCANMPIDMCAGMPIDMCAGMPIDMCAGMYVRGHVYREVTAEVYSYGPM